MIDIKIMAHPKRKENVQKMLKSLDMNESIVCWDDRPNGGDAMYTARKAWLSPLSNECTHRLVLQDDVELCDDFIKHATAIADRHKTHAVSFIHFMNPKNYPNHRNTPYYKLTNMPGCAIMLPRDIIKPCMDWCEKSDDEILKPHDDLMISKWCRENNVLMVGTMPCIVQHIGMDTLLKATYDWDRICENYSSNPIVDWTVHSVQKIK